MKYEFEVYQMQVEDHLFWVARSKILKGCLGQGDTAEIQHHSHHYADDAGIEQKGLGRCLYPPPGHLHQAIGPGADREHGDIGGAVENTDGAQKSRLQGVAHKAAVGEDYAEAQGCGPFGFLP